MTTLRRITLFKIPDSEAQDKVLEAYKQLVAARPERDGQPYIKSCEAYKLYEDSRSGGFTICANMVFANVDDMNFYDQACSAHEQLKSVVKPVVAGPPLILYYDA